MAIKPLVLLPPVIFAALAGLFLGGMFWGEGDELPSALIGQDAPATGIAELPPLPLTDMAALADGRVKLINFWASWCAPCRAEHPHLTSLSEEGIEIVGINYKDEAKNARAFLNELGNPYAQGGADPEGRAALDWGVYGIPETFVLDAEGRIVARMAGPLSSQVVRDRLRPALLAAGQ